jgi:hypothetical protein
VQRRLGQEGGMGAVHPGVKLVQDGQGRTRRISPRAFASTTSSERTSAGWKESQAVNHDAIQTGHPVNQNDASLARLGSLIAPFRPPARP